ncbi:MAG: ABC transporter ATP-binding protein [Tissierellaceae bacterium]
MYLQLRNLSKKFGNLIAVKDMSISIDRGELVSLLGPSGCGKTTTLKLVGGFLLPNSGDVVLEGINITNMEPEKRPVTTVFQSYALFPHMNVYENIGYGLKYNKKYTRKEKKEEIERIIEIVGLKDFVNQNITRLSGGQQQRVALARALILNPKVLLLDEPFSNLDAKLRIKMRNEIKELQKKIGITMIFVTHDQEEALSISDRIVIMNNGIIEQIGTPKEVYNFPENQFVADFIGRVNIIERHGDLLLVRPENIDIIEEDTGYRGQIVQKLYMGPYTTYFIEREDHVIQADISNALDKDWGINEYVNMKLIKTVLKSKSKDN